MTAKFWTFLITTLLLVTGCSKSEVVTTYEQEVAKQDYSKQQPTQEDANNNSVPIAFTTFTPKSAATRTITNLTDLQNSAGFGVFGYYTHQGTWTDGSDGVTTDGRYHYTGDGSSYSTEATIPNFMYNQNVSYGSSWDYSPVKYWPNDFAGNNNAVDNQSAKGSKISRVTFFAYAPWVDVNTTGSSLGLRKTPASYGGIKSISANNVTGDPIISYELADEMTLSNCPEDFLYAVVPGTGYTNNGADGSTNTTYSGNDLYLNMVKPKLSDAPIPFSFKHAVARFDLSVTALFDEAEHTISSKVIDDYTYIKLQKVSVSCPKAATFNLRTKEWSADGSAKGSFVISGTDILENLRYTGTETAATIAKGVGRDASSGTIIPAKTKDASNNDIVNPDLYQPVLSSGNYFIFMPVNGDTGTMDFEVTAHYHVFTKDKRMLNDLADIENIITNTVSVPVEKEGTYSINMLLGMQSVKLKVNQYRNGEKQDVPDASRPEIWPYYTQADENWRLPFNE